MAFPGESRRAARQIVVFERTSRWAIALRRALPEDTTIRVVETRLREACVERLTARQGSLAAVEWRADEALLAWLWRLSNSDAAPRLLLMGTPSDSPISWAARLAGVEHIVPTPRNLPAAIPWIQRHFDTQPARDFRDLREEIDAGLPWPAFASAQAPAEGDSR